MATQIQPIWHFKSLIDGFQILGGQVCSNPFCIIFSCFKNGILLYVYHMRYVIIRDTLYYLPPSLFGSVLGCAYSEHRILPRLGHIWQFWILISTPSSVSLSSLIRLLFLNALLLCKVEFCISPYNDRNCKSNAFITPHLFFIHT